MRKQERDDSKKGFLSLFVDESDAGGAGGNAQDPVATATISAPQGPPEVGTGWFNLLWGTTATDETITTTNKKDDTATTGTTTTNVKDEGKKPVFFNKLFTTATTTINGDFTAKETNVPQQQQQQQQQLSQPKLGDDEGQQDNIVNSVCVCTFSFILN